MLRQSKTGGLCSFCMLGVNDFLTIPLDSSNLRDPIENIDANLRHSVRSG